MPPAFEVGGAVQAIAPPEQPAGFLVQEGGRFFGRPHVVAAFLAFGVRVSRRVEAAVRRHHVVQHPVRGLVRDGLEQGLAGREEGLRVQGQQGTIVVQHFFEVRDLPVAIDRIAAETSAQVVVDAALRHARECQRDHEQSVDIGFVAHGAVAPVPQEPVECRRVRELGGTADAAVLAVEAAGDLCPRCRENLCIGLTAARRRLEFAEDRRELLALGADVVSLLGEELSGPLQEFAERRQAMSALVRKVGAAEERPLVSGVDEHRQRPAARAVGQELVGGLVDAVDVGTFLPVDLHVHEQAVHDLGRGVVLE